MSLPIATLDLETDPFEYGQKVSPFVSGYYNGDKFVSIWGLDCIERTVKALSIEEPHRIYIHNGGRFDLFFFLPYLSKGSVRIINNRIVECNLPSREVGVPHVIRDSYAILPIPLRLYDKDEIDYRLMSAELRDTNRVEITKYLKKDCTSLHELVTAFHSEFSGDKLTIGSTAITELKSHHKFDRMGPQCDEKFRKNFFFGGRNQCFVSGEIKRPVKVFDVNSMYPFVMKNYLHPIGADYQLSTKIGPNTCFVVTEGENLGAFPTRTKTGLDFTIPYGTFHTTIHEWNAALETKTFRPKRVVKCYDFEKRECFDTFVDHFYGSRLAAAASNDKVRVIFYKLILNSAYGKFAQNGDNFFDWQIFEYPNCPEGWTPSYIWERQYIIAKKKVENPRYNNVATGSSITGAARSLLLKGISHAIKPYYCDTDSIICEDLPGVEIGDKELGAWKLEATGNRLAIAGKKLYAVWSEGGQCIKKAHKGSRLNADEIAYIAGGGEVTFENPVPAFKFDGKQTFVGRSRTIRKTAHV